MTTRGAARSRNAAEILQGPWRRETGVAGNEEEHCVYLTNDAQSTLIVDADQVAEFVNDALDRGHAFFIDDELRLAPARLDSIASGAETEPDHD